MRRLLAISLVMLAPALAAAQLTTPSWVALPGGTADGMALGDVDGDGRKEIGVVLRGGTYQPGTFISGVGTLALLSASGALRWQVQTGNELVGFPTFGDFDGDGLAEVAICEYAQTGKCYVYDGDGSLLFSVGPFGWPAATNGGVTAADINKDGIDDLVIATYGGDVGVFKGPTGTQLWRLDMWNMLITQFAAPYGETFFSHPAVGDVNADGILDVVVCSYEWGALYAFRGSDGTALWSLNPTVNPAMFPAGNACEGNGPVLVNLDADAQLEMVVPQTAFVDTATSGVAAYKANGTRLWRTTIPGSLNFLDIAAADVAGDGKVRIFVQTLEGTLDILDNTGAILPASRSLLAQSWVTPGFIDVNTDGVLEVLASTVSSLYILDGVTLAERQRYDLPSGGLFPPPIQSDSDGDGRIELITGAWWPKQVIGFNLTTVATYQWDSFLGNSRHTGALTRTPGSPTDDPRLGNDPVVAVDVVLTDLAAAIASPASPPKAEIPLKNAIIKLTTVRSDFLTGDFGGGGSAFANVTKTIDDLLKAALDGYPTTAMQKSLAGLSLRMYRQFIDRAASIMNKTHAEIVKAETAYTSALAQFNAGSYKTSSETVAAAATALLSALVYVGNYCPAAPSEPYHVALCQMQKVRNQVLQLLVAKPADANLKTARDRLGEGMKEMPSLMFGPAFAKLIDAATALVPVTGGTPVRQSLANASAGLVRTFIDDCSVHKSAADPTIISAESLYRTGDTRRAAGDYNGAIAYYRDALIAARP